MVNKFFYTCAIAFFIIGSFSCKKNPVQTVPLPVAPQVSILNPANNATILDDTYIKVKATDDKGIILVEVYVDNTLDPYATFQLPPYETVWSPFSSQDGGEHTVFARAYDADGHISTSPFITFHNYTFTPTGLTLQSQTDTTVTLNWHDNSSYETGYEIEESKNHGAFTKIKSVAANVTSVTISDTFYSTNSYQFRVSGKHNATSSNYSNTVLLPSLYTTPFNVHITASTETTATIQWLDTNSQETGFEIEQSDDGVLFTKKYTAAPNTTSATLQDTILINHQYYIRMRAVSKFNATGYSDTSSYTIVVAAPSNFTIVSLIDDSLKLKWTDNTEKETGYEVDVSTDNFNFTVATYTGPNTNFDHISTTTISITPQTANTYYYKVRAITPHNGTDFTNEAKLYYENALCVGGHFYKIYGTYTLENTAQWNGSRWSPVGSGQAIVDEFLSYNNKLYAGGGGVNGIMEWNGIDWKRLGSLQDHFISITSYNNQLYAGGYNTEYIKRWDGTNWLSVGSGLDNLPYSNVVFNNELYVGGQFEHAGGVTVSQVAKWDGSTWSPVGTRENQLYPDVYALIVYNNEIYAGGSFHIYDQSTGPQANRVAKWNGTDWVAVGNGMNKSVFSLALYNNELYAAGFFDSANGLPANHIAKWNGSSWSSVGEGTDGTIKSLCVFDNELYAGGSFTSAGGTAAKGIAKWNGSSWLSIGNTDDLGSTVTINALTQHEEWHWKTLQKK